MADKYVVVGTKDPSANGTEEVILERDEKTGEVTKSVSKTHPADLNKGELEIVESIGVVVEKVSADQAAEIEASSAQATGAATDTAGAAPVLDQTPEPELSGGKPGNK